MRTTNNIIALFFILLLSFQQLRISNYSSSFESNKSFNLEKSQSISETQNIFFCGFSDQKQSIQNCLESAQKLLLKISIPNWLKETIDKYKEETTLSSIYLLISSLIVPSLETHKIIFPFHNFW